MGFLGGASGKELSCQCRRCKRCRFSSWVGKSPWRRAWQPLQYSCLENPRDRRAWRTMVRRVEKSRTWLKRLNTCARQHLLNNPGRPAPDPSVSPLQLEEYEYHFHLFHQQSCQIPQRQILVAKAHSQTLSAYLFRGGETTYDMKAPDFWRARVSIEPFYMRESHPLQCSFQLWPLSKSTVERAGWTPRHHPVHVA